MDHLQAVWLAIIQGLSEFLPISSSAHLILPSEVLGWPDQGLAFDVAVHVGSLMAVMIYFRKDIVSLTQAWLDSVFVRRHSPESRLAWYIILGTVPAGLTGLILGGLIELHLRSMAVIAFTTIFWVVAGLGRYSRQGQRDLNQFTWKSALFVGAAQALALIPAPPAQELPSPLPLPWALTGECCPLFIFTGIPVIILSGGLKGLG